MPNTTRKFVDYDNEAYIWEKTKNKFVQKEAGKGLSEANFTQTEKAKLENIQAGAEVNVNADWDAVTGDAAILNKPENLVQDANYVHTDSNYTAAEKTKLSGIEAGANKNVNADWNATLGDAKILNKPADLVQDANYVHTDSNYTAAEKTKLSGIETGANKNVNADWTAESGDAVILNKPENLVQDANYVHTDSNYTAAEKTKLSGIEAGAEANVNADWDAVSGDAQILNKPANLVQDANYVHTDANYTTTEKSKLSGIEAGATRTIIDSSVSDSSNNPISNSAIKSYVDNAIGGITGFEFAIVQTLPDTGVKGTIYLVPNTGETNNSYDEYIWITSGTPPVGSFEKIGTTRVDLSNYMQFTDMVALTTAEIDAICV